MPRPEKVAAVDEIKERLSGAQAVFLAEYAGLSVKAQQALRRSLKAQGAEFQVVKMTLARRAAGELELTELDGLLVGPTGIAYADGDAVAAAKVLKDFATANDVFTIKGGLLGTVVLTPDGVRRLADIEPREVLLSKLAGVFKAPSAAMAGLLAALPRGAATVFQALLDKKADGAPAAPEPETAPEATAEPDAAAEAVADEGVADEDPGADVAPAEPADAADAVEVTEAEAAPEEITEQTAEETTDETAVEAEEEK